VSRVFPLLLLALAGSCAFGRQRVHVDVVAWFAMTPPQFGCWLERTWGHRDPRWNCDLNGWRRSGDPCDDTVPYYEGPEFPASFATRVEPRLANVRLAWEHGQLQAAWFAFDRPVSELSAREAFGLPAQGTPSGLMSVAWQQCSKRGPCLGIEKFDHQGAGDVDCDAVRAARSGR
jgi:hypothetical protein